MPPDAIRPALDYSRMPYRLYHDPGRSKAAGKEAVSIRLDREVVAYFRAMGPRWQSRINAALRKAAGF